MPPFAENGLMSNHSSTSVTSLISSGGGAERSFRFSSSHFVSNSLIRMSFSLLVSLSHSSRGPWFNCSLVVSDQRPDALRCSHQAEHTQFLIECFLMFLT